MILKVSSPVRVNKPTRASSARCTDGEEDLFLAEGRPEVTEVELTGMSQLITLVLEGIAQW